MRLFLYCFINEVATSSSADVLDRDVRSAFVCCSQVAVFVAGIDDMGVIVGAGAGAGAGVGVVFVMVDGDGYNDNADVMFECNATWIELDTSLRIAIYAGIALSTCSLLPRSTSSPKKDTRSSNTSRYCLRRRRERRADSRLRSRRFWRR